MEKLETRVRKHSHTVNNPNHVGTGRISANKPSPEIQSFPTGKKARGANDLFTANELKWPWVLEGNEKFGFSIVHSQGSERSVSLLEGTTLEQAAAKAQRMNNV